MNGIIIIGILLHSDLNPAWLNWLSAWFSVVRQWFRWEYFGEYSRIVLNDFRKVFRRKTLRKSSKLSKNIALNIRNDFIVGKTENQAENSFQAWPGPVCNRMFCCIIGHFSIKVRCNDIEMSGNALKVSTAEQTTAETSFSYRALWAERAEKLKLLIMKIAVKISEELQRKLMSRLRVSKSCNIYCFFELYLWTLFTNTVHK